MRLTVQSFERKFNPEDAKAKEKLAEYSQTLIQQIDVMSSIASAFSDFAKMPSQNREQIELISVIKFAIDIFSEEYIMYASKDKELYLNLDKTQIIRVITNLVKNAIQATESVENPLIKVNVLTNKDTVTITVEDNGKGISEEVKDLIFEPKFTTKTSGMGLGLPMIKNIIEAYDGTISFTSKENVGTVFTVVLPKT
jgi:nitrogen fixation/metabolism regulation signal transduction histidine kinase